MESVNSLNVQMSFSVPLPNTGSIEFRTTHWTAVLQAARPQDTISSHAFAELYRAYWPPLYAYVRKRGYSPTEAEDLTQDFFARLLEKQALAGIGREGGKFRSYLLTGINHFLANEWDKGQAQKRGGGNRLLSLNAGEDEARFALEHADQETPESLFEKRWMLTLLHNVSERLGRQYREGGREGLFKHLFVYLRGDRNVPSYAQTATLCGLSEGAVKVAVHRMRQQYGEILREEIARTVSSPEEVEVELQYLISVAGR